MTKTTAETHDFRDWHLTNLYRATSSDGQEARVLEKRLPAKFYRIEASPTTTADGKAKPGYALETGSGRESEYLAHRIAQAIADGMLQVTEYTP